MKTEAEIKLLLKKKRKSVQDWVAIAEYNCKTGIWKSDWRKPLKKA